MKNKRLIFLLGGIAIIVLFSVISYKSNEKKATTKSPVSTNTTNKYLQKYASGYMVQITGQLQTKETEMYVLHSNGIAEWKFIEVVNGKANILSEKSGNWSATLNTITIKINGNTGTIEEKYTLINGKFTFGSRTLLRTN